MFSKKQEITYDVKDRFIKYVQIDTQADLNSTSFPSSLKQINLSKLLVNELHQMGIKNAFVDEWGYVYARIQSNTKKSNVPKLFFCAHIDTAPDCSGKDVKPILHKNWNGNDIVLPDDNIVINTKNHPYLNEKIGDDIITASGKTLLGADDKAGVAIIMDFANKLMKDNSILHGDISLLFTPDEEIGKGVDKVDVKQINADFGYTLDGGELGTIEDETFSADTMYIVIVGVSAHPGYAKGKMKNAAKIASEFIFSLPKDSWCPEATEAKEGFVHLNNVIADMQRAELQFIIRDHDTDKLKEHENRLISILEKIVKNYEGVKFGFKVVEQYRNMKDILDKKPEIVNYAIEAMKNIGITPKKSYVRGGTDGSRLSFMNLPCPNLFTGEMGIHSKEEYVSVQDMEKSVLTLIELVKIWENKS